ncbi:MAG TPA: hypothetical protein DCY10_04145 [Clostridiales bacterium]|nr:hypothetical protein [Clostridiales bacterium]
MMKKHSSAPLAAVVSLSGKNTAFLRL